MVNIWSFLWQTLALSVTALVLLLAKYLFRDKLSPRWQYGVWAVLALRALVPAGLLGRVLVPGGRVVLEAAKIQVELPLSSALADPWTVTEVPAPIPLFPRGLPAPGSATDLLFYVYAAGALLLALWFFLSYVRLRAALRRGLSTSPEVLAQVEGVAARYGLKAPRRVVVLPGLDSAFVCGPLRPVLALPHRPVDDKVLLHELLHLNRGDLWAGVGICALRCLHWCNPLAWHCCNRMLNDCESLCDQRVLERLEGEARREYGVILLSMADDRHARAPGTSSMANGGQNIKARINAIARFRRYPAGMALASVCVALVLAAACLGGVSGAVEVPDGLERGPMVLAQAQLNRPTTVAGALDTYAKALLNDSPLYLSMVSPRSELPNLFRAFDRDTRLCLDTPFAEADFWIKNSAWLAQWSVFNLRPDGDGGYLGTLFFTAVDTPYITQCVSQEVAVRPDGDRWLVEPLGAPECRPLEEAPAHWGSEALPVLTYTAQAAGLTLELDCQYTLGTETVQEDDSRALPQPEAVFTDYYASFGGRARDSATGEPAGLSVYITPLSSQGEEGGTSTSKTLPFEVGRSGGGVEDRRGVGLDCMAALELTFTYNGQTYTCTAYPQEVTP